LEAILEILNGGSSSQASPSAVLAESSGSRSTWQVEILNVSTVSGSSNVVVTYSVSWNPALVNYSSIVGVLRTASDSGSFASTFKAVAMSKYAIAINVTCIGFTATQTLTYSPSSAPASVTSSSTGGLTYVGEVAVIVGACVGGVICLIAIAVYFFVRFDGSDPAPVDLMKIDLIYPAGSPHDSAGKNPGRGLTSQV
jgi:hypothetical protein